MKTIKLLTLIYFFLVATNSFAQVAINSTGTAPAISSMLDITSSSSGLLIPRMTDAQRISIISPATSLIVYQTNGATGYYYYDGSAWVRLSAAPANTEWWIRPATMPYIQPISNSSVRVYDAGQTYGIFYDGNTNQYGAWLQTSSATSPTAAVAGFSNVSGNQTFGYLGYNGNYADGGLSIDGSGVYGVVDDPNRAAGFFRTTGLSTVAATIGYSNVWIPGYFKGRHLDPAYAGRPGVYGEMTTTVDVADYQIGVQGFSTYTGSNNSGYTVGGLFSGVGGTQDAIGVFGEASSTSSTNKNSGLYGSSTGAAGSVNIGVEGIASGGTYNFGLFSQTAIGISEYTVNFGGGFGPWNNATINDASFITTTGAGGAITLSGISGGYDGRILILNHASAVNLTIAHQSSSSTAANRIITNTGASVVSANACTAIFIYSASLSRWILISFNP
jgi:hypothetical protein